MNAIAIACSWCATLAVVQMISMSGVANADPAGLENLDSVISSLTPYASDDFDGADGQSPNQAIWNVETGGGGWGNDEQQTYTAEPANVRLDGFGHLILEANNFDGQLTSSRINTEGKVELATGLIEARIKMPQGQGLHPAFWMLGNSLRALGYPASGEIDIIELVNSGSRPYFAVHGPMVDPSTPKWKLGTNSVTDDLSADFHTYWLHKEPGRLTIGIDESPMATFSELERPEGASWVQDLPFFALLNIAVAGEWPGPLGPGALPAEMIIDWVRFYR